MRGCASGIRTAVQLIAYSVLFGSEYRGDHKVGEHLGIKFIPALEGVIRYLGHYGGYCVLEGIYLLLAEHGTVKVLEDDCIKRELSLIKVKYSGETRAEILSAADVYRAKVIDYTSDEMCIEITGDPTKIDAFIKLMIPYGIIEMCRTGLVALDRGSTTLLGKNN